MRDLKKPLIGVANTWIEIGPCNYHLRELAAEVKDGIRAAGGTPMEFNTVSISDGITMGTEGMRASLVSREVIADSIELVARGNGFDGIVALVGCDKTIPGAAMALARLNIPGLVLYGGSIAPGHFARQRRHDSGRLRGRRRARGREDVRRGSLRTLENDACPGAGACGGQFTANTMAIAVEFLGIAAMGSGSVPATRPGQGRRRARGRRARDGPREARRAAARHPHPRRVRERDRRRSPRPADRPTPCCTCWRSRAKPASSSTLDDFDRISAKHAAARRPQAVGDASSPTICTRAGGIALVAQRLAEAELRRPVRDHRHRPDHRRGSRSGEGNAGQEVVRPARQADQADRRPGDPAGNLAPEGCGGQGCRRTSACSHRGPARVFDSEEAAFDAVQASRSSRTTSSSSDMKDRAAARACARCSR